MSAAEIIQSIKNKWNTIGNNSQLTRAFLEEARSNAQCGDGGGVVWIKYDSRKDDAQPLWTFVPRGSDLWGKIPQFVPNFEILTRDYDPMKHCLLFLSVPSGNESSYGQMTRVNYDRVIEDLRSLQPLQSSNSWSFSLS